MYNHLLEAIGNTPLIRVHFNSPATIYAKLEYLNPGGSVKDRSAKYMIEQAEKNGLLKQGGTIIDATSGNHGIALAMIGAAKGYKVILTATPKFSEAKINTAKAYGAEVVLCKETEFVSDPESYHSIAVKLHQQTPNSYMPNQYYSIENTKAHYHSLGPEIWQQTKGTITHFFAAAGTGGTISGAGQFLKEQNPNIQVICIDSINSFRATRGNPKPYKLEGMGIDFANEVLKENVIDEFFEISDDHALSMLQELSKKHGFLVGPSSGAVAYAAREYAKTLKPTDVAIMIFGDSGRAYLEKNYYETVSTSKIQYRTTL